MRLFLNILILLCLPKDILAKEIIKDTIVSGKIFHVIMYNDSDKAICVGSYIPHTFIREGEWDYFYNDGKLYSQTFFNKDDKTGIWIYYDEQGNIIRETKIIKKRYWNFEEVDMSYPYGVTYDYYRNNITGIISCTMYFGNGKRAYYKKSSTLISSQKMCLFDRSTYLYKNIKPKKQKRIG